MHIGTTLERIGVPFMHLPPEEAGNAPVELFVIASGPPDYVELSRISGLSVAELRDIPLQSDTGYFQLYQPDSPVSRARLTGPLFK